MYKRITVIVLGLFLIGALARAELRTPTPVSPGHPDEFSSVAQQWPTFNWSAVETAKSLEIVVYVIGDDGGLEKLYEIAVPGGASGWTPSAEKRFLPGGQYAWTVRAVGADEASEWSAPMLFSIAETAGVDPNRGPVARDVTATKAATGVADGTARGGVADAGTEASAASPGTSALGAPTDVAIFAEQPDATGNTAGVYGSSSSPDGAGVVADNVTEMAPDKADLRLIGDVSADLNEKSLRRDSASDQTFNFENPGAGSMTLQVDGVDVVTTATDQDALGGLSCADGQVATFDTGSGNWLCSDFDADLLDGLDSTAFAPAAGSPSYVAKGGDVMTGPLFITGFGLTVGDDVTLENGETISNATDEVVTISDGADSLDVDLSASVTLHATPSSGDFTISAAPDETGTKISILAGDANPASGGDGGDIDLDPGAGDGAGADGVVNIFSDLDVTGVISGDGSGITNVTAAVADADTLDTLDSLQFLRSDTSDSFTSGTLSTAVGTTFDIDGMLALPATGISGAGTGSGLDADLLDGYDSTFFAPSSGSGSYVDVTGDSMFGILNMGANPIINIGGFGGTASFDVMGGLTLASALTLENGETITNGTDEVVRFSDGTDSFDIDLSGSVSLVSSDGVIDVPGTLRTINDNASSFRLRGVCDADNDEAFDDECQSYAGVFYNAVFNDTGGTGARATRAIYGSNENMDLELQGSNHIRITAVDDGGGTGRVRIAAEDQIQFHAFGDEGDNAETDNLIATVHSTGLTLAAGKTFTGDGSGLTGVMADTATELAANGANCAAGSSPLGVDEMGAVEGCFDVATQVELDAHKVSNDHGATYVNLVGDTMTGPLNIGAGDGDLGNGTPDLEVVGQAVFNRDNGTSLRLRGMCDTTGDGAADSTCESYAGVFYEPTGVYDNTGGAGARNTRVVFGSNPDMDLEIQGSNHIRITAVDDGGGTGRVRVAAEDEIQFHAFGDEGDNAETDNLIATINADGLDLNGTLRTIGDNASSFRLRGVCDADNDEAFDDECQSYAGIFYNAVFNDTGGAGARATRAIIGSNENMDLELQGSNHIRITAVDDGGGNGRVRIAAEDQIQFHAFGDEGDNAETDNLIATVDSTGLTLAGGTKYFGDGSALTGVMAATAAELAANGANCAAGSSPLGVDEMGAVEGCFDVATQVELDAHKISDDHAATYVNVTGDTMTGPLNIGAGDGDLGNGTPDLEVVGQTVFNRDNGTSLRLRGMCDTTGDGAADSTCESYAGVFYNAAGVFDNTGGAGARNTRVVFGSNPDMDLEIQGSNHIRITAVDDGGGTGRVRVAAEDEIQFHAFGDEGDNAETDNLIATIDADGMDLNGTLRTIGDNASSFRLRGVCDADNDEAFDDECQSYAGIFYNAVFNDTGGAGARATRAIIGSNENMDLELQGSNHIRITAVDDGGGNGRVRIAAEDQIQFHAFGDEGDNAETDNLIATVDSTGLTLAGGTKYFGDGSALTGVMAATAAELAANGANCAAGSSPLGVDEMGAVEGCFDVATQVELDAHKISDDHAATYVNVTGDTMTGPLNIGAGDGDLGNGTPDLEVVGQTVFNRDNGTSLRLRGMCDTTGDGAADSTCESYAGVFYNAAGVFDNTGGAGARNTRVVFGSNPDMDLEIQGSNHIRITAVDDGGGTGRVRVAAEDEIQFHAFGDEGDNAETDNLIATIDADGMDLNGTLRTIGDNASSFRLRGVCDADNDEAFDDECQSYAGIFYNAVFNDTGGAGARATRAIIGSNENMDLELQGSNHIRITAVDDGGGNGRVRIAAEDQIQFHAFGDEGDNAETDNLIATVDSTGLTLAGGTKYFGDGSALTGVMAATAAELAANGANCAAGSSPLGVDEMGAVEGCFDVATQVELDAHKISDDHAATYVNVTGDTMTGPLNIGAGDGDLGNGTPDLEVVGQTVFNRDNGTSLRLRGMCDTTGDGAADSTCESYAGVFYNAAGVFDNTGGAGARNTRVVFGSNPDMDLEIQGSNHIRITAVDDGGGTGRVRVAAEDEIQFHAFGDEGDNAETDNLIATIDADGMDLNGTLRTINDNATSFRLRGPCDLAGDDGVSDADCQSYAGLFYNSVFNDTGGTGAKNTRVVYGSNPDMDLEIQGSNHIRITAVDDGGGNGRVRIAAEDQIQFHAFGDEGDNAETDNLVATVDSTGLTIASGAMLTLAPQSAPPATCDASTSGSFYVDSDLSLPCFCDGTSWKQMDDFTSVCS